MRKTELIHPDDTRAAVRDALRDRLQLSEFDIVNNPVFGEIENDVLNRLHPSGGFTGVYRWRLARALRRMFGRRRLDAYRKAMCDNPWEKME